MLTALSTRGGGGRYMLYKPHSSDCPIVNFYNGNFAAKGRRPLTIEVAFFFSPTYGIIAMKIERTQINLSVYYSI